MIHNQRLALLIHNLAVTEPRLERRILDVELQVELILLGAKQALVHGLLRGLGAQWGIGRPLGQVALAGLPCPRDNGLRQIVGSRLFLE